MASSLRDIPGASGRPGRRRQRDSWQGLADGARPTVLLDPRQALGRTSIGSRRRSGLLDFRRRKRLSGFDRLLVLAVIAVALFLAKGLWSATRVHLTSTGLDRTDALTYGEARDLDLRIAVRPASGLPSASLTLDGTPVTDVEKLDDGFRWKPGRTLNATSHQLVLKVPRPVLPASRFVWNFVVDGTPPIIETKRVLAAHGMKQPVHLTGKITDPEATLTASGEPIELDDEGRFTIDYPRPPAGPITLDAVDAAGHQVRREVFVPIKRPSVRGVHMSAISWRTPDLRQGVFDLIDEGKINTVELDLKDEDGEIGYDTKIPLAKQIGSDGRYYELSKAVDELHKRGVRVIGRLVAFRDPILAKAAWADGHHDWVVQRPDGTPHGSYGGFTNMASRAVQQYNLDIAAEAAGAGVDEVLWDYIRRPEGTLAEQVFPGMPSTDRAVKDGVVAFLTRSHELLRAKGVFQGASLFGIAAGAPNDVGQSVPLIARHVDYIAPMVYPALWGSGQYRVPNPVGDPYTIVARSLEDFQTKTAGTGVHITPWLQDFSLYTTYSHTQVWQQIKGATDLKTPIKDFLLWSPRVKYHGDLLATDAG